MMCVAVSGVSEELWGDEVMVRDDEASRSSFDNSRRARVGVRFHDHELLTSLIVRTRSLRRYCKLLSVCFKKC